MFWWCGTHGLYIYGLYIMAYIGMTYIIVVVWQSWPIYLWPI